MRVTVVLLVLAIASLTTHRAAFSHHSFAAQFDATKPIMLEGVITKVEWRSPHIWVYFDVRDRDGKVTPWECEGGAPNQLTRQGWSRETLKLGEQLTVEGYKAKDGTNTCNARTWKLAGRTVLAGSADDGAPAR